MELNVAAVTGMAFAAFCVEPSGAGDTEEAAFVALPEGARPDVSDGLDELFVAGIGLLGGGRGGGLGKVDICAEQIVEQTIHVPTMPIAATVLILS
jgi:hypothetical protein